MSHDPRRPRNAAAPDQQRTEAQDATPQRPDQETHGSSGPTVFPASEFGPKRAPKTAPEVKSEADSAVVVSVSDAAPGKNGFDPQGVAGNFPAPAPARSGLRRKMLFAALGLLLLVGAAAGYVAVEADEFLTTPAQEFDFEKNVEVEILRGDTFAKVAGRLEKAGIISNALYFRLYAMWEGRTGSIQAGVFEFSSQWDPREVLHHLVFGRPVLYLLTIREGLPWWEVAKLAEENGFAKAEDFKEVIHDPEFLTKHNIPFANAEGFLFPDTYFLRKPKEMDKAAALALAERLVGTFEKKTKALFADQDMDEDKLKQTIILASMVEKETGIPAERTTVAGVFANRIKLGMLMQCDPTIIYGLGENFSGNIRKRDLEDAGNPYNTYQHAGLPPGPICSPGYAALEAAVHPAEHDYLYFVATKAGGEHVFNATLKDHINAVNKYQRGGRGN